MDKRDYRQLVAERKKTYTQEQFADMSRRIMDQIRELPVYQDADTVFAYIDLPGEVKMRDLIERCWEDGKTVAVPKIMAQQTIKQGEMRFYRIDSFDVLREGRMHILEPDPERCGCLDTAESALILMPGVAFDTDRRRIGYGGGFYDRYLAQHPDHPTLAAAYRFQVFERIPDEPQDIRPQLLVTEEGLVAN